MKHTRNPILNPRYNEFEHHAQIDSENALKGGFGKHF